jgi:hypothetical protein
MPFRNGNMPHNATNWTQEMIDFLKYNYSKMTNTQLALALGVSVTCMRYKKSELGLKKLTLEYWNEEMIQFLRDNYKTLGDVEIVDHFTKHFPKNKGWSRGAIWKKRQQINLYRTAEEKAKIITRHQSAGGRNFRILEVSSSLNMHASWIANNIAPRNRSLAKEILKHPEIIEVKRQQIILKRTIDEQQKIS